MCRCPSHLYVSVTRRLPMCPTVCLTRKCLFPAVSLSLCVCDPPSVCSLCVCFPPSVSLYVSVSRRLSLSMCL